ncbi:oxygen-insensitive NADPH nitroreductase [bacterium LRH843]|nr:oxygen-insensitive NADPH nitroreductase [bacterium LRH843]
MLNLLKKHVSVRQYTEEKIPDEVLQELCRTAQAAASSHFVQAYSIIDVIDLEKREKLADYSKNPTQINSAARVLIFCADLKRLDHAVQMHHKSIAAGTLENFMMAVIDTTILAQNFVIAAESKGYGICYIGGVRNNPESISELLSLPEYVIPIFGLTVGVPEVRNEIKPRLPVDAILHTNEYDEQKYHELLPKYDEILSEYYATRTSNNKSVGWTEGMAQFLSEERRTHMLDFVQSKGMLTKDC